MKLLLNVGRAWPEVEHVYLVGYRNYAVGRMWFAVDRQTDPRPWEWHLSIPMTLPDDSKGIARSMAEAVQELGNALHRLILQTPHDRLERAFQFAGAAGLNFDRGDEIELTIADAVPKPAAADQPGQALVKSGAVAGLAQRAAQAHAFATQTPTVKQATLPKKKMPVVRVQVARPAAQVAAPRPAIVTAAASSPTTSSAGNSRS